LLAAMQQGGGSRLAATRRANRATMGEPVARLRSPDPPPPPPAIDHLGSPQGDPG